MAKKLLHVLTSNIIPLIELFLKNFFQNIKIDEC